MAQAVNRASLGTLLFDLLTPEEELDRANVFDIELLASRLIDVTGWLTRYEEWPPQPIGYFGASTGAALLSAPPQIWAPTSPLWCRGAVDRTSPDRASPTWWHPHSSSSEAATP